MIVCIAEKPSVAKDIADVLGARSRKEGYFEGNGYQVTWTFGHLCTLKEPHDYTEMWKRWSLSSLPMIPPRFGIKLIQDKGISKQFAIIERLMQSAEGIVNCGDAGQEGELIQRWVMQKAGARCPVKRLWISSLTEESIREGFANLKEQSEYQSLYEAGLGRAIGDWLLGMNATRLYTLKYGRNKQVLSIGRVQTPTLALIVKRHHEIANFVPQQYWELKTLYRDTTFNATSGRFDSEAEAQEALQKITGELFTVTDVTSKNGTESPPKLYDLTSLQVDCNKKFGLSADVTLQTIQSLYEKKYTTYPRVDTTFLSDDIYPKCGNILKGLRDYQTFTAPLLEKPLPKSKKVFDNKKVTDHHAITHAEADGETPLVTHVTAAPELEGGMDFLHTVIENGATFAIGHSDATYEEAIAAVNAGAVSFSHLFNAMRPIHHRDMGTAGAGLLSDAYAELICDGIHLSPATVQLAHRMKRPERVVLITDSCKATGLPDGVYKKGSSEILVKDGKVTLPDGTISGSTLSLFDGMRNYAKFCGVSYEEAIPLATINPAKMVGLDKVCGSIEVGKRADMLVCDAEMKLSRVCICGEWVD